MAEHQIEKWHLAIARSSAIESETECDRIPSAGEPEHYATAWALSEGQCARAKLKLGSVAMRAERWEEARDHLADALSAKAHYAEAWYCCAVCWLKLDDNEKAMADLRKVIALDPTHYQAWSSLGGLFAKAKMKREALFAFRQARPSPSQPTLLPPSVPWPTPTHTFPWPPSIISLGLPS